MPSSPGGRIGLYVPSDEGPVRLPDLYEQLHIGQVIKGTVLRHAPFGIFVDIGDARSPGLAEFFDQDRRDDMVELPAVGSLVSCILLGFSRLQPDGRIQARFSLRQSRIRAAAVASRVEQVPPEHRFAFLYQLMADGNTDLTEAAAWRAWLLPEQDRLPLLLEALAHPDLEVQIRTVSQVGELTARERSVFLQHVLSHDVPAIAEAAVWQAGSLSQPARATFLELALAHSQPNVVSRAQWYIQCREPQRSSARADDGLQEAPD